MFSVVTQDVESISGLPSPPPGASSTTAPLQSEQPKCLDISTCHLEAKSPPAENRFLPLTLEFARRTPPSQTPHLGELGWNSLPEALKLMARGERDDPPSLRGRRDTHLS